MIGKLEAQDCSLADTMFELLRCAHAMETLEALPQDDLTFHIHAKTIFFARFQELNTELSWFCLFLHPLYRKLAIAEAECNRTYDSARIFALKLAKRWNWDKKRVLRLMEDLSCYRWAEKEFNGASENAREWWTMVRGSDEQEHALKSMALILLGLVPHAAEVERLFSSLGAIQGDYRANLNIRTFEQLGMLRLYLTGIVNLDAIEQGKVTRRTSAQLKRSGIQQSVDSEDQWAVLSYSNSYGFEDDAQEGDNNGDGDGDRLDGDGDGSGTTFPHTTSSFSIPTNSAHSELKKPSAFYNFKELRRILEGRAQDTAAESSIIPHRVVGQNSNWSVEELTEVLGLTT
jgi:hypothetical protein